VDIARASQAPKTEKRVAELQVDQCGTARPIDLLTWLQPGRAAIRKKQRCSNIENASRRNIRVDVQDIESVAKVGSIKGGFRACPLSDARRVYSGLDTPLGIFGPLSPPFPRLDPENGTCDPG
jgi:hypothetical protein